MSFSTPIPYTPAGAPPEPSFVAAVRAAKPVAKRQLIALTTAFLLPTVAHLLVVSGLSFGARVAYELLRLLHPDGPGPAFAAPLLAGLPSLLTCLVAPFWGSTMRATARLLAGSAPPTWSAALTDPARGALQLVLLNLFLACLSAALTLVSPVLLLLVAWFTWPAQILVAVQGQSCLEALIRVAHSWLSSPWRTLRATLTVTLYALPLGLVPFVGNAWIATLQIVVVDRLFEALPQGR